VEIKIGVQYAARELVVESEEPLESVEKLVADAVSAGGVLTLRDRKGKHVIVPAEKIAYVEIGSGTLGTVGFRS
jgi:hypothetical protein